MMYGQMTAGSWIYIGSQGIVQGTYETFVEMAPPALRRRFAGKLDSDRGPGRHGRRTAAGRDHGRASMLAIECRPSRIDFSACDTRLSRPARPRNLDEALAIIDRGLREIRRGKPVRSACSAMPPKSCPRLGGARRQAGRSDRPDLGPRPGERLSAHRLDAGEMGGARETDPAAPVKPLPRKANRWRCMSARCWRSMNRASPPSTTATTSARWRWTRGVKTPSISRASCRPISARCSAVASGRFGGPRCPARRRISILPTPRSKS